MTLSPHSPPPPAEPIASWRSVDLGRHYLTVNSSHQQHKAHWSHDFTCVHHRHHEIQHNCYDWKGENGIKCKRAWPVPLSASFNAVFLYVIGTSANTSATHPDICIKQVADPDALDDRLQTDITFLAEKGLWHRLLPALTLHNIEHQKPHKNTLGSDLYPPLAE